MERNKLKNALIGDKAFYKVVLAIAIPVMIQNGITQFVSVLDNLMVGAIGTEQMSGVAICNQLIFVFNLCIFGGLSGAGIYGAQFHGKADVEGVRNVFRFKLWVCITMSVLGLVILGFFSETLISQFLHEGSEQGDLLSTLTYGKQYLRVMLLGLPPYALSQTYASTLRETKKTTLPMVAGIAAVLVNLLGNWVLIFGHWGAPALGVVGAAAATVLSRFVELFIILFFTHRDTAAHPFIKGVYKTLKIPAPLAKTIFFKGMPLLVNEALWSGGQTMLSQIYSYRGLAVIAAANISSTIANLFNIVFLSLGSSIGIVVGNLLGAGKMEEAKRADSRMIAFSVASCLLIGGVLMATAGVFPQLYNTTEEVRTIARGFIFIAAAFMPVHAFTHACYFTLRSGGLTKLTMVYDCCFVWLLCIPAAMVLVHLTDLPIITVYALVASLELVKSAIGYAFVKQGKWLRNIVE